MSVCVENAVAKNRFTWTENADGEIGVAEASMLGWPVGAVPSVVFVADGSRVARFELVLSACRDGVFVYRNVGGAWLHVLND